MKNIFIYFICYFLLPFLFSNSAYCRVVFDVIYEDSRSSSLNSTASKSVGELTVSMTKLAVSVYFRPTCSPEESSNRKSHIPFYSLMSVLEKKMPLPSITYSAQVDKSKKLTQPTLSSSIHYRWSNYIDTVNTIMLTGSYTGHATIHYYSNRYGQPEHYQQNEMEYVDFWILARIILSKKESNYETDFHNYRLRSPLLLHSGIASASDPASAKIELIETLPDSSVRVTLINDTPPGSSNGSDRYLIKFIQLRLVDPRTQAEWSERVDCIEFEKNNRFTIKLRRRWQR